MCKASSRGGSSASRERITRVEVALSDLNSRKLGERDKRCIMEARLGGMQPIAVSHEAPTLTEAIHVAADKLERAVEDALCSPENVVGPTPPRAARLRYQLGPIAKYAPSALTPARPEIKIRGSVSRRGTQAVNGDRL